MLRNGGIEYEEIINTGLNVQWVQTREEMTISPLRVKVLPINKDHCCLKN